MTFLEQLKRNGADLASAKTPEERAIVLIERTKILSESCAICDECCSGPAVTAPVFVGGVVKDLCGKCRRSACRN